MSKYSKRVVNKIVKLIEDDNYTVMEICKLSGITKSTYFKWLSEKKEFSDKIEAARAKLDSQLIPEAKNSLMKKITGYTVTESKIIYTDASETQVKEIHRITKHIQPDTQAIITTLCNKDPINWKIRRETDVSFSQLTDEQLQTLAGQILKNL